MGHDTESIRTAHAMYDAWSRSDRRAMEALLAPDFHFTSPLDNRLDRAGYFTVCWPHSGGPGAFELVGTATAGDRVWVTYENRAGGRGGRNTEVLTIRDGLVAEVEVYFGWSLPHEVAEGTHRDPG